MSEEFWMMAIAAVFSGIGNVIQVWRGGRVRDEREIAERVAREVGRRHLYAGGDLDAVRREFVGKPAGRVLDRTVGLVISESMRRKAGL